MAGLRVWGIDLSLTHAAIVELGDSAGLNGMAFITTKAGSAETSRAYGMRMPDFPKMIREHHTCALARIEWMAKTFVRLMKNSQPDYAGIEDYAYDEVRGAHQLGEMAGEIKRLFYRAGIPLRVHDIGTIKLFATGDGRASKDDMVIAAQKRGHDFTKFNLPVTKKRKGKPDTVTGEDLSDAYHIACMVLAEAQLRSGAKLMKDFAEHEIRAFNRVTDRYPENLLARDWTVRKEGEIK